MLLIGMPTFSGFSVLQLFFSHGMGINNILDFVSSDD